jgi:hypothetical protein
MWSVYNCTINAIIQIFVSWTFNVCFTPLSAVNIIRFLAGLNYIKQSSFLYYLPDGSIAAVFLSVFVAS